MGHSIPSAEPDVLIAGDSWQWDKQLSQYPPSDGWALTYHFQGPAEIAPVQAAASSEGDYYEVRETPEKTEAYTPGTYRWAASVSDGTDRHTILTGVVRLVSNLETAGSAETHAEKCLAAINAALEGRFTEDTQSFTINGRAVNQIPVLELKRLQSIYRSEVWRERNPGRLGPEVKGEFVFPS